MWKENEKKPIAKFLIITFLISWVAEFLAYGIERTGIVSDMALKVIVMSLVAFFGALAPGVAVYILLKKAGKISGWKDYLKRVFDRKGKGVFWLTLISVFTVWIVAVALTEEHQQDMPYYLTPALLVFMIPGGGWEELGWRGFLQPALEEKMPFPLATLLMGCIWSVWHLPLWLLQSASQKNFSFFAFALYCISFSFLLAITYYLTQSVFAAILLHAWGNTTCGGIFTYHVLEYGPTMLNLICFVIIIVGSMIVYYLRRKCNAIG